MAVDVRIVAEHRFGLGGVLGRAGYDPYGAKDELLSELTKGPPAFAVPGLPSGAECLRAHIAAIQNRALERIRNAHAGQLEPAPGTPPVFVGRRFVRPSDDLLDRWLQQIEGYARYLHAVTTPSPFVERLTLFWSNHFTVSAENPASFAFAGAFEREAIRPNVLGSFRRLLGAAFHHPGMQAYLDNVQSLGPNSRTGLHSGKGLNENLAREVLELHTLGVNGGYTQADVTEFARAITGFQLWSPGVRDWPAGDSVIRFEPRRHEPGQRRILGKRYEVATVADIDAILDDLAAHPSTARFIALKLARHFVGGSDQAVASVSARLEQAFLRTEGDLGAVSRALVLSPEVWSAPPAKIRAPFEWVVAVSRALATDIPFERLQPLLRDLGQRTFSTPGPNGWSELNRTWTAPALVKSRLDWVHSFAQAYAGQVDIEQIARNALGDAIHPATIGEVTRAASRPQALTLLFMSPEFLMR